MLSGLAALAPPKFEVASIKPCHDAVGSRGGEGNAAPPGRLILHCQSLGGLINVAFVLFADGRANLPSMATRVSGVPDWAKSARYDINAKAEGSPSKAVMQGPMLQALLEERFQVKVHRETKEIPVYALTVAKNGPKLQPFQPGSCRPVDMRAILTFGEPPVSGPLPECDYRFTRNGPNNRIDLQATTLEDFARMLGSPVGRPVEDRTGIPGQFDFHLEFAADEADPAAAQSIFTAIQKFGLKLEAAQGTGTVVVIDRVERPSGN